MNKIKVAINGFGRIGMNFLKLSLDSEKIEVVAINDLDSLENKTYFLKNDSVYRMKQEERNQIYNEGNNIFIKGKKIKYFSEKDPEGLPWNDLEVDLVIESTGFFKTKEGAEKHIKAGAKKVLITAPVKKEEGIPTILFGVSEDTDFSSSDIFSNASCTTNACAGVLNILDEKIGIDKAILNTIHSYTSTQNIVDGTPNGTSKDLRKGRAGALNIIPSTTGSAIATTQVLTSLSGKFDGVAVRVPTPVGSLADITFLSSRDVTVDEVNKILEDASKEDKYKRVLRVTDEEIVSSDILGIEETAVIDKKFTKVVDGNLVKIFAWYDNEVGYSKTLILNTEKIFE